MQKKKINKIPLVLCLIFLSSCSLTEAPKEVVDAKEFVKEDVEPISNQDVNGPSKVIGAPRPISLDFAGEKVNLQDWDVQERLDYELTVNMYYHSKMQFYLKRANRWFPLIEPILKEQGLPDDFKYLAVIESALSQAISPSGAKGFWQFMPATGKEYNLEINGAVDERYHIIKSTYAACEYLKKGKKKFGNWTASAASYNMGKTGLQNKMNSQYSEDYFDLKLNNETSRYIFRLLAIKTIMKSPEKYGFNLKKEHLYEPYQTKSVIIDTPIVDLAIWAKEQKTNYKIVKKLNPWILGNSLKASASKKYTVLLPTRELNLKPMAAYE